jgi:prepilin-type N-terminal cleavage/methylation domain-containing protein
MNRRGFTFIEILIVMILIGLVSAMMFPRLRTAFGSTNVRGARAALGTLAAKARAAAVARGCRSSIHFTSGIDGTVWVTVCKVKTSGLDTLGGIEHLASRFNVILTSTSDSVTFAPSGISFDNVLTILRISTPPPGNVTDSVMINQVGKVVR